jgi:hypothetical protein
MKHTLKAGLAAGKTWCRDADRLLAVHAKTEAALYTFVAKWRALELTEAESALLNRLESEHKQSQILVSAIQTSRRVIGDLLIAFEAVAKMRGLLN